MSRKSDNHPEVAGDSFAELVKASNFTYINAGFKPENDSRWPDKGDQVRGELALISMKRYYRESDLHATLAGEEERRNQKLHLASAYELAHYASNGWNSSDWVLAFGSSYADPDGLRRVACLWGSGAKRGLDLSGSSSIWGERLLVLCAIEKTLLLNPEQ